MHPEIFHLAERLVIAMESMSQDVKNMSAYVHDISCSVSYLLNQKREKECIPVSAWDESDNPPNVISAAGEEASAEGVYSGQYEQADEGSSSQIADQEHGESSFGYVASMSIDSHEVSNVLSSESNPVFTGRIKIEDLPEVEETDESSDVDNMYGDSRNDNTDPATFLSRHLDGQTLVARTSQLESANDTLMADTRLDSEEKPYKCSLCEKSFKVHRDLQRHIRVHTGEKPYKCNVCRKAFSRSDRLTLHLRSHTDERSFRCNVCGMAFAEKSILTQHMLSHPGEMPYRCNICGKACRKKSNLNVHMRSHTGETPYKCNMCGKAFRYHNRFIEHMRAHSGEHTK